MDFSAPLKYLSISAITMVVDANGPSKHCVGVTVFMPTNHSGHGQGPHTCIYAAGHFKQGTSNCEGDQGLKKIFSCFSLGLCKSSLGGKQQSGNFNAQIYN